MTVEFLNQPVMRNAAGQPLRRLSLVSDEEGINGFQAEAGDGVGPATAKLNDNTGGTEGHITAAIARELPEFVPSLVRHDGTMVIVGSGPSVSEHVEEIRAEKALGRPVMAIKGAHDWLIERGIEPDLWVSMDSQDKIVEGVRCKSKAVCYLAASKVAPSVFDWLADQQVVVWHAWMGRGEEKLFPPGSHLIGGGSTSGLRGVTIAYLLGFRRVVLFGFDSCLAEGKVKRVTGDKVSDWTMPVQVGVNGRVRTCDGAMASQATEFQAITLDMMPGLKVKVVGDGLLADIMAERQQLGFNDW